jgi:hypothetical protein
MEGKSIFISSCSRRQLARRRLAPRVNVLSVQLMVVLVVLLAGFGAFVAGHGGL